MSCLQEPEMLTKLVNNVKQTLTHAIEVEENIPLKNVKNFDEIFTDVQSKLMSLKDFPNRSENPIIYHLDVG